MNRPPPRVNKKTDTAPISTRTRSQTTAMASVITPAQAAQRQYPAKFLQSLAMPILEETSGQLLQYSQLRKHPKFAHIWNTSYTNELGRLFQGIGQGSKGPKHQRVEGTNNFRLIKFANIPQDRENKFATPWLSARSKLTMKIPSQHASTSQVVKFVTLVM